MRRRTQQVATATPGVSLSGYRSSYQVEHWPLNDASGNMSGVGGKDLSVSGSPTYNQSGGKGGNGIRLNVGDYLFRTNADVIPVAEEFCFCGWINTTRDAGSAKNICNITNSLPLNNPNLFAQALSTNNFRVGRNSATVSTSKSSKTFNDGVSHHWLWGLRKHADDYYELMLYLDGVKRSPLALSGPPGIATTGTLVLGRTAGDAILDGVYDNWRFNKGDGSFPSQELIDLMVAEYD